LSTVETNVFFVTLLKPKMGKKILKFVDFICFHNKLHRMSSPNPSTKKLLVH